MRLQLLGSGSRGNAALLWVDDAVVLLDAGLSIRKLTPRLEAARIGFRAIDHVLVTHGHLDHARSAGIIAKRHGAVLHCAEKIRHHRSLSRAPEAQALVAGRTHSIAVGARDPLDLTVVGVPHDCDPTYAFRLEHGGRRFAHLTDIGEPREDVARSLEDPDVLVIESNHDVELLRAGPYTDSLKARVMGAGGHLSNAQMAVMLARITGPRLHTVVLAHLSEKNNRPDLALEAARGALAGRPDVRIVVATQDTPTEVIDV